MGFHHLRKNAIPTIERNSIFAPKSPIQQSPKTCKAKHSTGLEVPIKQLKHTSTKFK